MHWISYSSNDGVDYSDNYLGIATFDTDGTFIGSRCVISPNKGDDPLVFNAPVKGQNEPWLYATNDHFIMPWRGGVYAGVVDRSSKNWMDWRLVLFKIRPDMTLGQPQIVVTNHVSNLASGTTVSRSRFPLRLLVPGQVAQGGDYGVVYLKVDPTGRQALNQPAPVLVPGEDLAFGTLARPGFGWYVITFRSPADQSGQPYIGRYIFSPGGTPYATEQMIPFGDRPHTKFYRDAKNRRFLLTTWDADNLGCRCHLRAEELTFS